MPSIMSRNSLDLGIIMVSCLCSRSLLDDFSNSLLPSSYLRFSSSAADDVCACGAYCLRLILGFDLPGGSSASSPPSVSSSAEGSSGVPASSVGVDMFGVVGKLGCVLDGLMELGDKELVDRSELGDRVPGDMMELGERVLGVFRELTDLTEPGDCIEPGDLDSPVDKIPPSDSYALLLLLILRHLSMLEGGMDAMIGSPVVGEMASHPWRMADESGEADA
jgi:hypothetical protein